MSKTRASRGECSALIFANVDIEENFAPILVDRGGQKRKQSCNCCNAASRNQGGISVTVAGFAFASGKPQAGAKKRLLDAIECAREQTAVWPKSRSRQKRAAKKNPPRPAALKRKILESKRKRWRAKEAAREVRDLKRILCFNTSGEAICDELFC